MSQTTKHFEGQFQTTEDSLNKRYFKLSIFREPRPDHEPSQFVDDPLGTQTYSIPGSIKIVPGGIGVRLSPVKRCIYCGSLVYAPRRDRPLSDEHIVSGALGGNIILNEASCKKCADYTSGVESSVLNELFWASRHRLRLRSRTQGRARKPFAFSCMVDGKTIELKLPLDRHPTMLFMPVLRTPGILTVRPRGYSGVHGLWSRWLNDLKLSHANEIFTPTLDTVRFCQFIAKIGHAFAVAAIGTDTFEPLLGDFIQRKFSQTEQFPGCYHWIGGFAKRHPRGAALHELGLAFTDRSPVWFLSAQIRLFANLGAPVYVAVVGKLSPGLTPEQALARWKFPRISLERTLDKNPAAPP
ncbi:MAG TPA: hypothetical protein VK591_07455 [Xanthobacteraceae bacterium]|nr:hypothetical protein [Xanthobacteraceae bacterium]